MAEEAKIAYFDKLEKREPSTERMKRLKARCRWKHVLAGEYIDPDTKAGIERMRLITRAYKENEGQPEVIKRAKFLGLLPAGGTRKGRQKVS